MADFENNSHQKALNEKRKRVSELLSHIKPPLLVELGCGSGFVMELIQQLTPESLIIGLDTDIKRLRKACQIGDTVQCDITDPVLADGSITSAALISALHVVYSRRFVPGVEQVLNSAARMLKQGGRLIIYDHVSPQAEQVKLQLQDSHHLETFVRFAREFSPRKIEYNQDGTDLVIDVADAVEFIRFCRPMSEAQWREAIGETGLFWNRREYTIAVDAAGFDVKIERIWREPLSLPESVNADSSLFRQWIGIVAEKR